MSKKKILVICGIMILLLGMGFAAGRADLKINGHAKMDNMKWKIHFIDLDERNTNTITATTPAAIDPNDDTKITFAVDNMNMGDTYEFDVDIENAGTIDAELKSMVLSDLATELQNYVEYEVEYTDGSEIKKCDTLDAGQKRRVHVKLAVKDDVTAADLPNSDDQYTFTVDFNYVQSGECNN